MTRTSSVPIQMRGSERPVQAVWHDDDDDDTFNVDVYSQQLQHVHANLRKPTAWKIVVVNNNATIHSARITQEKILNLSCSVLTHPRLSRELERDPSFSFSLKSCEWENISREDQGKTIFENHWTRTLLNFNWKESTRLLINGKRLFKIMQIEYWLKLFYCYIIHGVNYILL